MQTIFSRDEVPECFLSLGDDTYRCKKYGQIIRVRLYPLHCECPTIQEITPSKKQDKTNQAAHNVQQQVKSEHLPGTILHNLIKKYFGEDVTGDCQCGSHIEWMNAWGPVGCREHLDEIVGWLQEEAIQRGWKSAKWPGARWAMKIIVLMAMDAHYAHSNLEGSLLL